jgi:SAM-dependent methyltransferase
LDLGTGTGVLARAFAQQGASVCGIDISPGQIKAARKLAQEDFVNVDFQVAAAESVPYPDHSFDVITANQCWFYFDLPKTIAEVKRLLRPEGVLVTSHFSWLPRKDRVARASEELILRYNPQWSAADWPGIVPDFPLWAQKDFDRQGMFFFDEPVPFTHETWRGRIRASRGIGASLSPQEIERFDREHQHLLEGMVAKHFVVMHRIDAHVFSVKEVSPSI